jgi:hypothetical protein
MAKKDNLVKLAKGTDKKTKTPAVKQEEVPEEKVLTPEEQRDLKAKAKVSELLEGVDLVPKKEDELLEVESERVSGELQAGNEWLEEQVQRLTEENEKLKSEIELSKEDYAKMFQSYQQLKNNPSIQSEGGAELKIRVGQLFNELQAQYLSLGANFYIHPPSFLLRLIKFFPFLENQKKF